MNDRVRRALINGLVAALVALMSLTANAASKVVYLYNWYGETVVDDAYERLIEEFQRRHPEVEVEAIRGGGADRDNQLLAAIVGGTPPDLVQFERSIIVEWANKGLLQPLDKLVDTDIGSEWLAGTVAEVAHNGKHFGLPWDTDIRGLFWNKRLLGADGFDEDRPPLSMDELDSMARKLTRTHGDGGFSQLGFIPWIGNWYAVGWLYTFGGDLYDAATKTPVVNNEGHVAGFEWIRTYAELYPPQVVQASYQEQPFIEEKVAMIAHESGHVGRIAAGNPSLGYGVGEVPHPLSGQNGTWMGGTAHVIPTGARNVEGARTLLEWLASAEAQAIWWRETTRLPAGRAAIEMIRDELPPEQLVLISQADRAFGRPPLWYPPIYLRTAEAMSKVLAGEVGARIALDEAQRLLEQEFQEVFGE